MPHAAATGRPAACGRNAKMPPPKTVRTSPQKVKEKRSEEEIKWKRLRWCLFQIPISVPFVLLATNRAGSRSLSLSDYSIAQWPQNVKRYFQKIKKNCPGRKTKKWGLPQEGIPIFICKIHPFKRVYQIFFHKCGAVSIERAFRTMIPIFVLLACSLDHFHAKEHFGFPIHSYHSFSVLIFLRS